MAKRSTVTSAAPSSFTAGLAAINQPLNSEALSRVYAAVTAGNPGYAFVTQAEGEGLLAHGLITINGDITDGNGGVAAITSAEGNKLAQEHIDSDKAAETAAWKFEIDDNVPLVNKRGGGGGGKRERIYNFDALNIGQSFHLPATAEMPKPNRSIASAVSNATAEYAVEVKDSNGAVVMEAFERKSKAGEVLERGVRPKLQNTRVFTVRAVDASDPRGPGARVYRTA